MLYVVENGRYAADNDDNNEQIVRFSVDSEYELYNLDEDPNETKNVAGDHKDLVAELSDLASKAHVDSDLFPIKNCVSS